MIGEKIKQYLTDHGIMQKFLIEKTGIRKMRISDICAGKCRIEVTEYYKICKALNVPLETFLDDVQ